MKILYITTISLTMNTFFVPHIEMLVQEGHKVDIACNYKDLPLDQRYEELGCRAFQVDFSRSPLSVDNIRAFGQLNTVIQNGGYDIVHCHTPNASVITRLVCRKYRQRNGLKVFYTAHGFHFYKGAPKLNWMVFYPVEKICSRYTDKLITINQEDYTLAKEKFHAKEVCYVPGVGVDLSRFENVQVDRTAMRQEIGVPEDAFLLFSVGELNENKNHQVIIRALAKLNNRNIHYAIAGEGDKREYLLNLAESLGVADQVHLLGYRKDIAELNCSADVFCFPSFREGLGVSAMEAMACGLPVVASDIRGISDYSENGVSGFSCNPSDEEGMYRCIEKLYVSKNRELFAENNRYTVKKYDISNVLNIMKDVYEAI